MSLYCYNHCGSHGLPVTGLVNQGRSQGHSLAQCWKAGMERRAELEPSLHHTNTINFDNLWYSEVAFWPPRTFFHTHMPAACLTNWMKPVERSHSKLAIPTPNFGEEEKVGHQAGEPIFLAPQLLYVKDSDGCQSLTTSKSLILSESRWAPPARSLASSHPDSGASTVLCFPTQSHFTCGLPDCQLSQMKKKQFLLLPVLSQWR